MLAVKTPGLERMLAKLRKHKDYVKRSIAHSKLTLAGQVFKSVVEGSPQWSGNLASNWRIDIGSNRAIYKELSTYDPVNWHTQIPYFAGHERAVGIAMGQHFGKSGSIVANYWNKKIYVSNATPYAAEVELGVAPEDFSIRPENYTYGQIAMVGYAMTKFGALRNKVTKI